MQPWVKIRTSGQNHRFHDKFIRNWIESLPHYDGNTFLDISAGNMPYRSIVADAGFRYLSQDFGQYSGDTRAPGLQAALGNWPTSGHSITCNITDLPHETADFFLCTEVLEHVPDPVAALKAIANSAKGGAVGLITVPFSSRMHQAPFWFSSGLSPYRFIYHAPTCGLEITGITKVGDFVDVMIQEIGELFDKIRLNGFIRPILNIFSPPLSVICTKSLLESGALGVYVSLKKLDTSTNSKPMVVHTRSAVM